MIVVAIAALDFGAMRAMADHWGRTSGFLGLGGLPMANALAFGLFIGHRRRESHRFLFGFLAFGTAALALYAAMILFSREMVWVYFKPAIGMLGATIGPGRGGPRSLVAYSFLSLWASLPQLAVALVGGYLSHEMLGDHDS
jgi:hypothetical protein